MTITVQAVYRDGAFHPISPPDVPEGATVQLTWTAADLPDASVPSPQEVYRILKSIADRPMQSPGGPTDVAENHDKYLYDSPHGVR